MSQDRLSRHELTWLLAQEARGAAKTLRDEVSGLNRVGVSSEPRIQPVETTLDALDDAIEMLSTLNTATRGRGRRGRIDLAALLYEVSPNARISIEPGAGTEVFGDEADLRRMLSVLATQASAGAGAETEVCIRRQGDWIKISVELGPDVTTTGELERRWLSRMATRHGGWVELEGGTQSILLQADGASDKREVTELRKELQEAQQLGEAYARELATILADGEIRTEPPPRLEGGSASARFEALRGAASAIERTVKGVAEALRGDISMAHGSTEGSEFMQSLNRRASALHELSGELGLIAECPLEEAATQIDLVSTLRITLSASESRASRHEIAMLTELPAKLDVSAPARQISALLRLLLDHALSATPRGAAVRVALYPTELGVAVTFEDGGPPIPEAARTGLLHNSIDPSSVGRPTGIALVAAQALAHAMGAELALRDGAGGATETWLVLPRASS